MTKPVRALVAAVLLCISFAVFGHAHLSSDPAVRSARELVKRGRFDAALDMLRPLAPAHPDRIDIFFLVGLAAIEASRLRDEEAERNALLDEAIAALRAILVERPELVRVRLELARAFFLKGEDSLSREHFERVLSGQPSPGVAANIQRYLATMRARRRWTAHFGITIAPDSNLDAASEVETIYLYGRPFERDAVDATSGVGAILWGGGAYEHPLTDRMRLRAGADVAQRDYAGRAFDQTFLSMHAGPRWLMSPRTEVSLRMDVQQRWSEGGNRSRDLGARLTAEHRLSRRATVHGRASLHRRAYRNSGYLDGPRLGLSFGGAWVVSPTVRVDAAVGYRRERPESIVWRNATKWARAGVSVALPRGFTVSGGGELQWTRYRGRWDPFTPIGVSRHDRSRTLHVSVLHRAVTIFGFSPQVVLAHDVRSSNAQAHDYRRYRGELRFVRQF